MIIGIIKDGEARAGFKLIPIMIILSFFVFFATRAIVSGILPAF